ncbi:MAG: HPF/RaiA family ribosome-associated protein [Planctomycetaceae bacterium]|nr:HPF/RaiA family ribosome-associated protein [Planctomycetaceae bacterium]
MHIQVKAGSGAHLSDGEIDQISTVVEDRLARYRERLTSVEVFISDENSREKHGKNDKRCLIEARPAGLQPVAVEVHTDNYLEAVDACAEKVLHALEHRFGRLES